MELNLTTQDSSRSNKIILQILRKMKKTSDNDLTRRNVGDVIVIKILNVE